MPSKSGSASLPYAYPWRADLRTPNQPLLAVGGLGFIALGIVMLLRNLSEQDYLNATILPIFFGSIGIAALGAAIRVAKPRGSIHLVNAVILTVADVAPVDSWAHLIRFRRANVGAVIIFFAFGLGLIALTAVGAHHVIATSPTASGLWRLVPASLLGALGTFITVLGVRVIIMGTRTTSVGARPVGVALGESGLTINLQGEDSWVPWSSVELISAGILTIGRRGRGQQDLPTIDIRTEGKTHRLAVASLSTPALLAYAALKFYWDNPPLRSELGTTVAQRRFDEWHAALIAR